MFTKLKYNYFTILLNLTGICINLKGREPNGIVNEEEFENLRNYVAEILLDVRLENGEKIFTEVQKTEGGPDIIFSLNPSLKQKENLLLAPGTTPSLNLTSILVNGSESKRILINNKSYELYNASSKIQFIDYFRPGNHKPSGIKLCTVKKLRMV
jgi:hypothetical protein